MRHEALPYLLLGVTGSLIASLSQVLLKTESGREHGSFWKEYLNVRVIAAYLLLAASVLLTMLAYRGLPLSTGGPLFESCSYVFVTLFGVLLLHERLTRRRAIALALIFADRHVLYHLRAQNSI